MAWVLLYESKKKGCNASQVKEVMMRKLVVAFAFVLLFSAVAMADNIRPVTPGDNDLQNFFDAYVTGATYDAINDQSEIALFTPSGSGSVTAFVFSSIGAFAFGEDDVFGIYSPNTLSLVPIFGMQDTVTDLFPQATVTFADFDLDGEVDDVDVSGLGGSTGVIEDTYFNFGAPVFGYYTEAYYESAYVPGDSFSEIHYTEDSLNPKDAQGQDVAWALTYNGHGGTLDLPGGLGEIADFSSFYWLTAFEVFQNPGSYSDYDDFIVVAESVNPVPEPGSLVLIGTGLAGLGLYVSRRRKS